MKEGQKRWERVVKDFNRVVKEELKSEHRFVKEWLMSSQIQKNIEETIVITFYITMSKSQAIF